MDPYIPSAIVVAGWILTHLLTLRAQRVNLRLQALDRARNEISRELRTAQSGCGKIVAAVMEIETRGGNPDWRTHSQGSISLLQAAPHEWISRLEEYEILFPETAAVRERLVGRQRSILERLSALTGHLTNAAFGLNSVDERRAILAAAQRWLADVHDQSALLEDMIVHLQNEALSKITGRRIPARIPRDQTLPRIVKHEDGLLWIEPDKPERLFLPGDPSE
jgi:hypothetical protein